MSALQDCYATLTTPFGAGGQFYDGTGHRGADYAASAGDPIFAYDDMVVEYVGVTAGLGGIIGLRRVNLGGYAGYAHVVGQPARGTLIQKGAPLSLVAGWDDVHGRLWTGPHIHTTDSAISAYNAAEGIRPLTDPAPTIAAAIATGSPAGGGTTPIPTINRRDTMQLAYIPKGAANGKDSLFLLFGERFYLEFVGQSAANAFNTQIGGNTAPASRSFFDAVARAQGITSKVEVVNLDE